MQIREIEITHQFGLHARACARVVALASRFRCNVALVYGRRRASASSIVSVMLLAVGFGGLVRVETDGPDESAAMTAMIRLLTRGLAAPAPA
jgi:phosphocarrier protein